MTDILSVVHLVARMSSKERAGLLSFLQMTYTKEWVAVTTSPALPLAKVSAPTPAKDRGGHKA